MWRLPLCPCPAGRRLWPHPWRLKWQPRPPSPDTSLTALPRRLHGCCMSRTACQTATNSCSLTPPTKVLTAAECGTTIQTSAPSCISIGSWSPQHAHHLAVYVAAAQTVKPAGAYTLPLLWSQARSTRPCYYYAPTGTAPSSGPLLQLPPPSHCSCHQPPHVRSSSPSQPPAGRRQAALSVPPAEQAREQQLQAAKRQGGSLHRRPRTPKPPPPREAHPWSPQPHRAVRLSPSSSVMPCPCPAHALPARPVRCPSRLGAVAGAAASEPPSAGGGAPSHQLSLT